MEELDRLVDNDDAANVFTTPEALPLRDSHESLAMSTTHCELINLTQRSNILAPTTDL